MGHRLIPEAKMKAYGRPPKTLSRSPGHYKEWVDACRGESPAGSNFVDHGGLLSEACLSGNVALRSGKRLLGRAEPESHERRRGRPIPAPALSPGMSL